MGPLREEDPGAKLPFLIKIAPDLTDVQIAATLGCSPGTVRSQLSRALAKLRDNPVLAEGDD